MYVFNLHFEDTWEDDIKTDVEGMGRKGRLDSSGSG